MQSNVAESTFENIHFPQRLTLIKNLRRISFVVNDVILFISCIVFFAWATHVAELRLFLFERLHIIPESGLLFLLAGITLLFGARRHLSSKEDGEKDLYPWWNIFLPIFFAVITSVLGLSGLMNMSYMGWRLDISPVEGLCFVLLGVALIPPFTRIPHRFHITQLLVFIVSGVSMLVVLENVYQLLGGVTHHESTLLPFSLSLTFAFFCFGVLLRWSNRGFFGNFTLDSTGSMFALRIVLINLLTAPLIALVVLSIVPRDSYNLYQAISLIVVFFTFISSLLLWINVKLLYNYELEHLLMRETLKSHNIDLTKEDEILKVRMEQIEVENQQYKDKLNVKSGWQNVVDNSA